MNGTNRGFNVGPNVSAYAVALKIMGEVTNTDLQLLAIPGIRNPVITDAAVSAVETRFDALYIMDIEQLDFANGSFDAVLCGHGFQFVPDLSRALGEARRVLKLGGHLAASVPVSMANESVWALLDSVIERWLPPVPVAVDQQPTRAAIQDAGAFRQTALDAGFATARVELIEETVRWESAEHLVSMFMGWWNCASRLEGLPAETRENFASDAIRELERAHPGAIETKGRNHVLSAQA